MVGVKGLVKGLDSFSVRVTVKGLVKGLDWVREKDWVKVKGLEKRRMETERGMVRGKVKVEGLDSVKDS